MRNKEVKIRLSENDYSKLLAFIDDIERTLLIRNSVSGAARSLLLLGLKQKDVLTNLVPAKTEHI